MFLLVNFVLVLLAWSTKISPGFAPTRTPACVVAPRSITLDGFIEGSLSIASNAFAFIPEFFPNVTPEILPPAAL